MTSAAQDSRLIAVGDIHGSLDGFTAILRETGLISNDRRWSGGTTTLVQTGDYTDRGADVRAVMDLLMALEQDARSAGGRVVTLLGNHEVMNLIGVTRDATPAIFATFADAEAEKRRETAWREYEQLAKARLAAFPEAPDVYRNTREAWMAAHPPGFLEYRQAFSPDGVYGRWLRDKDVVARLERTVFMHAGMNPETTEATHEEVNAQVRSELRKFDAYVRELANRKLALPSFTLQEIVDVTGFELRTAAAFVTAQQAGQDAPRPTLDSRWLREALSIAEIGTWALLAPEGPLWFRGYATWPNTATDLVEQTLRQLDVDRLVTGHTPQRTGIAARFGGRLFLIDTGMLASVYNGVPSALEMQGTRVTAIVPGRRTILVP